MTKPGYQTRMSCAHSGERGYAMMLALSMVMVLLMASLAVIANVRIEGKRQREEEAIWRGNQYVRAIRLFYHKTGHYPRDVDELAKGLPQLHFLRQVYKDPMNTRDGAWRFVYVNAAGQLIGSTKYSSLQQMAFADSGGLPGQVPGMPGLVGTPVSSLTNSSGFGSVTGGAVSSPSQTPPPQQPDPNAPPLEPTNQNPDQGGQNPGGQQQPTQPTPAPTAPGATTQSPFTTINGQSGNLNPIDNQKPTGPVDGPVLGAFLTGVAGKIDAPSQKVYHRGKKYLNWEFIWNPLEDAANSMQQTLNPQGQQPGIGQPIGQGALGPQGGNPFGGSPTPQLGPQPGQPPQQ